MCNKIAGDLQLYPFRSKRANKSSIRIYRWRRFFIRKKKSKRQIFFSNQHFIFTPFQSTKHQFTLLAQLAYLARTCAYTAFSSSTAQLHSCTNAHTHIRTCITPTIFAFVSNRYTFSSRFSLAKGLSILYLQLGVCTIYGTGACALCTICTTKLHARRY